MGFFDKFKLSRLKEGLSKTRESLIGSVQKLFSAKTKIDDELLSDLEEVLLGGDVGVDTTAMILEHIRQRVKQEGYENAGQLETVFKDEVEKILMRGANGEADPFSLPPEHKPHVIMVIGVNGVGKTTTIGKLAYNY